MPEYCGLAIGDVFWECAGGVELCPWWEGQVFVEPVVAFSAEAELVGWAVVVAAPAVRGGQVRVVVGFQGVL